MSKYVYIVSSRESGLLGVYSSKQKAIDTLKNYMYHENLVITEPAIMGIDPINWDNNLVQIDCKNKDDSLPNEYLVIDRNIVW